MSRERSNIQLARLSAEIPMALKLDFERKLSFESSTRGEKLFIYQKIIELICEYTYEGETKDILVDELLEKSKEAVYDDVSAYLTSKSKKNTEVKVKEIVDNKGNKKVIFGGFNSLQK
jgi:hypothetical protein